MIPDPSNSGRFSQGRYVLRSLLAGLFSILVCLIVLGALFQLDYPFIQFIRSIHNPVLNRVGDMGTRLGSFSTLVPMSLALFVVGYVWKHEGLRRAGWQSLMAYAVAGIIVQIAKRLLGRPRPRYTHQDLLELGPSLQSGMDAFPSGHSATSFAVAAVVARHFPRLAWVWYGAAMFFATSRVYRGSHFLTDAMAGSIFGFLVGYVVARPMKDWVSSCLMALKKGLPVILGSFAVLWVLFQHPSMGNQAMVMAGIGGFLALAGVGLRWLQNKGSTYGSEQGNILWREPNVVIALGLAISTGSLLVVGLTLLAILGWWLGPLREEVRPHSHPVGEVFVALGIIGSWVTLQQLKSVLPLL